MFHRGRGSGKLHAEFKPTILGSRCNLQSFDHDPVSRGSGNMHKEACDFKNIEEMAVQLRGIAQDAVVEYFYLNFMSYQWHLYVSIMLLVANLGVQLGVALLEMLGAQVKGIR